MTLYAKDTIAALATAPLPAGVAVIRVSGDKSKEVTTALLSKFEAAEPDKMMFGVLKDSNGEALDEALVVYFKAPRSFTGEDVVEIHCHGGKAVIDAILAELRKQGVRMAEAGEFSKRAFMNGKMDLTAAEGIMDIVAAETEAQRKQALNQLQGDLGNKFEDWRKCILHMLAHVEAAIDFPDEELDVIDDSGIKDNLTELLNKLEESVSSDAGIRIRDGFQLSIIGKPNAGKSSLTNLLTGRDTAIVSDIEGTTRDVVESHLNIKGFPVILADTAGLRETDDVIEKEGVVRAQKKASLSDINLVVVDAREWPVLDGVVKKQVNVQNTIFVLSKKDLVKSTDIKIINNMVNYEGADYPAVFMDLTQTDALNEILDILSTKISSKYGNRQNAAVLTRERHKRAVEDAIKHLKQAESVIHTPSVYSVSELVAQDFRDAARSIGEVTGRTDTEDVLDVVFSSFCIGK